MPQVPQFGRQDLPEQQATGPQRDIAQAGEAGQSLAQAGQETVNFASKMIQAENFDWTANNSTDFAQSQNEAYLTARQTAAKTGDYKGAATTYIAQLDADQAQRVASAPDPRAADAFLRSSKGVRDQLMRQMSAYATTGEFATWKSNTQANLDQLAQASYRNPQIADHNYQLGVGIISGAQAAGIGGDNVDWQQQKDDWGKKNAGAVVRNAIDTNPSRALSDIQGGKYDGQLQSEDLEQYAHMAQSATDREAQRALMAEQRAAAQATRAEMTAERELRQTQATNGAQVLASALKGQTPDNDTLASMVQTQQITPETATAAIHAGQGHDSVGAVLQAYKGVGDGSLTADNVIGMANNHQISLETATKLIDAVNARGNAQQNATMREGYNTLKTALNGAAVEATPLDKLTGAQRQEGELWVQAQGEWTQRVVVGHQDPHAVLSDMITRYSPKADLPTWLPAPQSGAIMAAADLPQRVAQTKALYQAGQISPAQYQAQGQLLLEYQNFFQQRQAQAQIAAKYRPGGARPPAAAPMVPADSNGMQ